MARSSLTIEQHKAAAMLIGMWYDPDDHTYNSYTGTAGDRLNRPTLDADTMEPVDHPLLEWSMRKLKIANGELGAYDAIIKDVI